MNNIFFEVKGSFSATYGLFLFSLIGWLLDMFFGWVGFGWLQTAAGALAIIFLLAAIANPIFWHTYKVILNHDSLQIKTGLFSSLRTIDFATVQQVKLNLQDNTTVNLDAFLPQQNQTARKLIIHTHKGKDAELSATDFEDADFNNLVKKLKEVMVIAENPETWEVESTFQKCQRILAKNQQLKLDFLKSIDDAYASIMQRQTLRWVRNGDEARLQAPDIAFKFEFETDHYHYYLVNDWKPNITEADREMAQKIMETSFTNLKIVEQRLAYLQKIADELKALQQTNENQKQIRLVADRVAHLQKQNLGADSEASQLGYTTEVNKQLRELSDVFSYKDDMLQMESLKQYAELLEKWNKQ